jgi:hypothetical protein
MTCTITQMPRCKKIAEAEAVVSVNEKKCLVCSGTLMIMQTIPADSAGSLGLHLKALATLLPHSRSVDIRTHCTPCSKAHSAHQTCGGTAVANTLGNKQTTRPVAVLLLRIPGHHKYFRTAWLA